MKAKCGAGPLYCDDRRRGSANTAVCPTRLRFLRELHPTTTSPPPHPIHPSLMSSTSSTITLVDSEAGDLPRPKLSIDASPDALISTVDVELDNDPGDVEPLFSWEDVRSFCSLQRVSGADPFAS